MAYSCYCHEDINCSCSNRHILNVLVSHSCWAIDAVSIVINLKSGFKLGLSKANIEKNHLCDVLKWCLRHWLLTVVGPCSWRLQTAAASAVSGSWRGWAQRVDLLLALTVPPHASHTAPHLHPPSHAASAVLKHIRVFIQAMSPVFILQQNNVFDIALNKKVQ